MPFKRTKYAAKSKPTSRATRNGGRTFKSLPLIRSIVPRGTNGLPREFRTTLVYHDSFGVTGALTGQAFNMNSLFDPDNTGVGHQPMYFDQLMVLYNHYKVVKSKLSVVATSTVATPSIAVLYRDDDGVGATSLNSAVETANAKHAPYCLSTYARLSMNYDAAAVFGSAWQNQDSLIGSIAASPAELSTVQMTMAAADQATSVLTLCSWKIVFDVIFTELKTVAGS